MRKLLILALAALSACSFALQSRPAKGRNECTASPVFAVIDTVMMLSGVAAIVAGADRGGDAGNVIAGTGAMGGVVFLGSAVEGYRWSGQCQESRMQSVARR